MSIPPPGVLRSMPSYTQRATYTRLNQCAITYFAGPSMQDVRPVPPLPQPQHQQQQQLQRKQNLEAECRKMIDEIKNKMASEDASRAAAVAARNEAVRLEEEAALRAEIAEQERIIAERERKERERILAEQERLERERVAAEKAEKARIELLKMKEEQETLRKRQRDLEDRERQLMAAASGVTLPPIHNGNNYNGNNNGGNNNSSSSNNSNQRNSLPSINSASASASSSSSGLNLDAQNALVRQFLDVTSCPSSSSARVHALLSTLSFNLERAMNLYFADMNLENAIEKANAIKNKENQNNSGNSSNNNQNFPSPSPSPLSSQNLPIPVRPLPSPVSSSSSSSVVSSGVRPIPCIISLILPNGTTSVFDMSSTDTFWSVYERLYTRTYIASEVRAGASGQQQQVQVKLSVIDGVTGGERTVQEAHYDATLAEMKLVPTGTIRVTLT